MSERVQALIPTLAALSEAEKEELVEFLTADDDGEDEVLTREEWEAAWLEEVERRMADRKAGKTVGVPAEEVSRRMREKYG
jgi:putative addiction module component (TIGR02574 family)